MNQSQISVNNRELLQRANGIMNSSINQASINILKITQYFHGNSICGKFLKRATKVRTIARPLPEDILVGSRQHQFYIHNDKNSLSFNMIAEQSLGVLFENLFNKVDIIVEFTAGWAIMDVFCSKAQKQLAMHHDVVCFQHQNVFFIAFLSLKCGVALSAAILFDVSVKNDDQDRAVP